METEGFDSDGKSYATTHEMWHEYTEGSKAQEWYAKGVGYWQNVDASVDGVLGGYGHVNDRDVRDSELFLTDILRGLGKNNQHLVALDCGAGVGRVTRNLLLKHFDEVDLVEPVSHFLETAQQDIKNSNKGNCVSNYFCIPLQEFTPDNSRYDVIWIQWCIGHLTDSDLISFLNRAKAGLKPGGFFILKENITRNSAFVLDKEDHSVTRSDKLFCELFEKAGLHVYKTKVQKGFPKELFPVQMYALTTEPLVALENKSRSTRARKVSTVKII